MGNKNGLEGVGIFLAKKLVDKDIDMSRASDRMIVIKILVQGIIMSVTSVYTPKYAQIIARKMIFMLILVVLGEKKIVVIAKDFNGHNKNDAEDFKDHNGGHGYGVRNKECERILEFCEARNRSSSPPEVFLGKSVLKICSKFTREHPCLSLISIKLQSKFIEITLRHRCFPVNLLHILRTPFPRNASRWLLLDKHEQGIIFMKIIIQLGT